MNKRVVGAAKAFLYVFPALVLLALFVYWPLLRSFILSFHGSDIFGRPTDFVGLSQYAKLLTDPDFQIVVLVTLLFTIGTVIPTLIISVAVGLLLNSQVRGSRFFRSAFAMPFAFSAAAAGVVFSVLFDPATGVLNSLLSHLGIDRVPWLTDPTLALISVTATTVWMQLGYSILVVCAGLANVPDDVIEAAKLDGASGWRLNRHVVLPLISPQLFFLVVTGTIQALQSFGQINLLTGGGPDMHTTNLVYSIYTQAFANSNANFGYASAQAIVLFIIVALITVIQFRFIGRKVHYS